MADPRPLPFDWADPFALDAQLSDEERMVRDTAEGKVNYSLAIDGPMFKRYGLRYVTRPRTLTRIV